MYSLIFFHGKRFVKLQNLSNLRASSVVQNAFSFCNSSFFSASASAAADMDGGKGKNFTVSYLVESLGFTTKLAESVWKKVSSEGKKGNSDSVLSLLRSYGFTDSHISNIIRTYPRLLISDAEKSLAPKLQFLQSRAASTSELTEVLSKVPKILGIKKDKAISRYYDFVKEIIEADKSSKFKKLCHSLPEGSKQENKLRNLLVLRELGVPQRLLFPLFISNFPYICGIEKFQEALKKVVEMGFDPTSSRFVQALKVVYGLGDNTIQEKVDIFCTKLGFTEEDVWEMFKKWPLYLTYSGKKITQAFETLKKCGFLEDEVLSVLKRSPFCIGLTEKRIETTIETFLGLGFTRDEFLMMAKCFPQCIQYSPESVTKKIEFVVKQMNWPVKAVILFPQVTSYSMEKRIVPRCNVIKALMSNGLLGDGGSELPSISSVLACTDQSFLKKYVMKHDDKELVRVLMTIFTKYRAL